MNRDMAYYRKMRAKHIRRKKRIANAVIPNGWGYEYDGMYSKGKIHCSCSQCSSKTRNKGRRHIPGNYNPSLNYKHSDKQKLERMEYDLQEYAS